MRKRTLRLKEMPCDDSAIRAILAELERLFAPTSALWQNRKAVNILRMIDKKRFSLSILQNKTKTTARTLQFTVVFKPRPWLLDAMRALRILARNGNRKIKRRR